MAKLTIMLSDKTLVSHKNLDPDLDEVKIDNTLGVITVARNKEKEGYWYNKDAWLVAHIEEEVENESD